MFLKISKEVVMLKKSTITMLAVLLLSVNIFSQGKAEEKISTRTILYDAENNIKGFLAEPEKSGKYPGIIVIHEWLGLNSYIEERTKDLAKLGYVALAVDMYNGKVAANTDEARVLSTESRNNIPKGLSNLSKAVAFIKSLENVNAEKIASLGFCFGGGWSYQTAKNNLGTKVSVIYYGTVNPKDDLSNMKTIILGNFGGKDASIKVDTVKEFENVLTKLNRKNKIYIYDDAAHAFDNKDGQNYNKEASELAWKRTVTFLKTNL